MQQQSNILADIHLPRQPVLPDITVIIPTVGREILEECLYRIVTANHWPAKLIVVNQGSTQRVNAWLKKIQSIGINTEHIPSSRRGKSAALNFGIGKVGTRFVAITDDDCFIEHNWLEKMITVLYENPGAIITGPAYPEGDQEVVAAVTLSKRQISYHPRLKFDLFCGSNMGVALTVIEKIGWFDEDPCFIAAAEDCEWAYRALRSKVPIIYAPDVIVWHFGWRTSEQRYSRYQAYARSHGYFYGKYLRMGDWFIALRVIIHHLRAGRRWLKGKINSNHEDILHGRAYFTGLLPGIIAGIRRIDKK